MQRSTRAAEPNCYLIRERESFIKILTTSIVESNPATSDLIIERRRRSPDEERGADLSCCAK